MENNLEKPFWGALPWSPKPFKWYQDKSEYVTDYTDFRPVFENDKTETEN